MHPVDPSHYSLGQLIEKPLYLSSGLKLLGVGSRITEGNLRLIRRLSFGELVEGAPTRRQQARYSALRSTEDSIDVHGGEFVSIDRHYDPASSSNQSSFAFLTHEDRELVRSRARRLKGAQLKVAERFPIWERMPRRIVASEHAAQFSASRGWPERADLVEKRNTAVQRLAAVTREVMCGGRVMLYELDTLVDDILKLRRSDPGRFASYALLRTECADYLQQHSYTTACLAVAAAEALRWDDYSVFKAGLAGLVADMGMLHVPSQIRTAMRPLDEFELNRIWRHTAFSVVLLDSVDGLPDDVARAVYEHHEREDGSGYPHAARSDNISDLARILASADAYAAAVYPRPYRPGKTPHEALAEIVRLTATGHFSREMVGALVRAIGLYPVGSLVRLSNGYTARVVSTHHDSALRPVVQLTEHRDWSSHDGILDLATGAHGLSVSRALPEPGFHALAA